MNRIQPKSVDVAFCLPIKGIFEEKAANFIGILTIEVKSIAPGVAIPVGKIGTEVGKIVSLGTEMVIDDIQDDRQTFSVAGIHEALESGQAAIRILHRVRNTPS